MNNSNYKGKNKGYLKEFTKGIIKENPVLILLLGTCPTLGVTTMASAGVGMGLATTFVLLCSNIFISLLKNIISDTIRIPAYIVTIAGFTTLASILLEAYVPSIYAALGIYLPLITVNCIILARAEMFASKNKVIPSILDALGMGLGFTLALTFIGSVREILGSGTIFGLKIMPEAISPMNIFITAPGGFFVMGIAIALVNKIANRKPPESFGCESCHANGNCAGCGINSSERSDNNGDS
ncbi:MAG: electron transport complex subunit E [Clostridiales bacterium]|nr:electron transport complex subunit E [Clostridiales bacterium]